MAVGSRAGRRGAAVRSRPHGVDDWRGCCRAGLTVHRHDRTDLGSNVLVVEPSMPVATIQAAVDRVAVEQVPDQSGTA